jgi:ATP-binding cassette subfamily A (ABC1) protein 3
MRRNLIYRKRNIIGTLLEIFLPILFVFFLVLIKNAVEDTDGFKAEVIEAKFPSDSDVLSTFSFSDYVISLQAKRVCNDLNFGAFKGKRITGLPPQGLYFDQGSSGTNWQVPFVKCDSRFCDEDGEDAMKYCEFLGLGVAASSKSDEAGMAQAKAFQEYVYSRYPVLANKSKLPFDFDFLQMFDSDEELEDYVKSSAYHNPKLALGVVFDGTDASIDFHYKIRVNSTGFNSPEDEGRPATVTTPPTDKLFENFAREDKQSCPEQIGGTPDTGPYTSSCTGRYTYNGALVIQRLVNDFIMVESGARDKGYFVAEHGVKFASFPSKEYTISGFFASIAAYAPLLVTLGLLYPVAAITRYIVLEKELRQKELMKMMSVKESDIGWSWFISFLLVHIPTIAGTTFVSSMLFEKSSTVLLLIFWVLFMVSMIVFTFFVSAFFSNASRATLVSLLVFFAGYFLTNLADYDTGSPTAISGASLHPVGAFAYGLAEIGRLEDAGVGLTFDTFGTTDSPSGYTFQQTMQNFIFDCIFWGILSWYANRIVKSDYGRALPFYFPFTLSYWCPGSVKAPTNDGYSGHEYGEGVAVEEVSNALKDQTEGGKSIEICQLRKDFGDKTAVDGLNMSIYSGQITALLGHNGAGKTTTINMLTGMLAPSAGFATVAGKDIRTDMNGIREEIGICLQHDCLFPQLTVTEHIDFFARIKGLYSKMSNKEAKEKIDTGIKDVALWEKRNTFSKNLSGGMKRKLSVAIAFCGDSKTVLLDEPTSGMDPFSRRFTWNVIRQYRQGRCIILTTHFMDEADVLGDRIAIMAEGRLRCLGSALFLKKTYGVGYQLTIEKPPESSEGASEGKGDQLDKKLEGAILGNVPEGNLLTNVGTELSFQLPLGASSSFTPMFEQLDDEVEKGNIVTYGVSITTLDEVFLLVARGDSHERKSLKSSQMIEADTAAATKADEERSVRSRMDLENDGLVIRHIGALFQKRAANFKRDKKAWCCTTILPSLFVLLGFLAYNFTGFQGDMGPLVLDLGDLNAGIDADPQNLINFNSGNSFSCQPGKCIFEPSTYEDPVTGELFHFCGAQAYLENNTECTIEAYEGIISRISEGGAAPLGDAVTNVSEASYSLADSALKSDVTQYGGIYISHDSSSETEINSAAVNFSSAVVEKCRKNNGTYETESECENYAGMGYVIQYNFTALHIAPLFQTLADEAIVREALNQSSFRIKTVLHPLPQTQEEDSLGKASNATLAWFLIILSFPFITGAFASFVVEEKQSKAKHLQTIAGVKPFSYWLSTWLWDIANYQIPLWITVGLMFAFDIEILTTSERGVFGGVVSLLILFGPAAASFTYCITFLFSSPSVCNMFVIVFGFVVGMGGPLASFILRILAVSDPSKPNASLTDIANIIDGVLRFIPSFCLGKGILNAINVQSFEFLAGKEITVWDESVLLLEVIYLGWQSIIYLFIAMKIDEWSANPAAVRIWKKFTSVITLQCLCNKSFNDESGDDSLDDDVAAEQDRVLSGGANNDLIVLSQLSKVYDNGKKAVNKMSLGIAPGQCFGLLGVNGAGKTTTMGMLTAEFPPSGGDATLAGFSVTSEPEKTRRRVGYCPQFDAHFSNMTGREHVELYASIKGVPVELVKEAASRKLAEVGLSDDDSDRLSAGYSGGMKRRLSLACATIGQPQIVFLDECSTGVDPVARREIWQMISGMVSGGNLPPEERTSVILTTHSMEECEALCPRIGIMAGGRLSCLGSAQHLKSKFGQGYQVEMKIKNVDTSDSDYVETLSTIASTIAAATNIDLPEKTEPDEIFLNMEQTLQALEALTGDQFLASMVQEGNQSGSTIYKEATSPAGIDIEGLASFATGELRMKSLNDFVTETYPSSVIRERQDAKARYEVSSKGIRIGDIFRSIEEKKDSFRVAEYGVSQTSLEQVFMQHAAEAEALKKGTNDA